MATNYQRGVEKERLAMDQLEKVGYKCMRTAGSHGPFDLIAIHPTGLRFIQVKRVQAGGNWQSEYEIAKEEIADMPHMDRVTYEIWVWEDGKGWIKQEVV